MFVKFLTSSAFAIGACASLSLPGQAADIARCNFQETPGNFVPGLHIYHSLTSTQVKMGTEGLTRAIYYDDTAVMEYVKARFPVSKQAIFEGVYNSCGVKDSSDSSSGQTQETVTEQTEVSSTSEPVNEAETDEPGV